MGGAFVRAYQRSFPGEVAALVFTNSSYRIGFKAGDKADLIWRLSAEDIRHLRMTAEAIASDKPLTPQERSVLSNTMLALLDRAEPIE